MTVTLHLSQMTEVETAPETYEFYLQ